MDEMTALWEHSTTAFAVLDEEGRFLKVNPAICRLTGYTAAELSTMTVSRLVSNFELPDRGERQGSSRVNTRSGPSVNCRIKITAFPGEKGETKYGLQAEPRSGDIPNTLRTFIDSLPGLLSFWDVEERNVFANKAYVDFFGWTPQEMYGHRIEEIIGKELYQKNKPYVERALQGEGGSFERTFVDVHGNTRNSVASYFPQITDGKVEGVFVFVTDNTALKTAQLAGSEARRDLQNVLDAAKDFAIIATDEHSIVRLFSKGAEALLGFTAAEMVGKVTPVAFHDPVELAARQKRLSEELGRPVGRFEIFLPRPGDTPDSRRNWTYVRKDGGRVAVSLVVSPIEDAEGRRSGFLGIARDVSSETESRRKLFEAIEMAEEANHSKSLFLANMSHEIRTPMNGVLGIAQLLADTPLNDKQRGYVGMIRSAGHSLLHLINDILDFSKVEAGKMGVSSSPFNLADVIRTVMAILSLKANEKGLELTVAGLETLPSQVVGDSLRIQQVLVNLLGNALKFTDSGRVRLVVEAGTETTDWCFRVQDSGIGMTPEQVQRIFQPFVQAEDPVSEKFGGTGLGLALSKKLVELMGGTIGVESRFGEGSEFWFRIPLKAAQEPVQSVEEVPVGSPRFEGRKFLVVDDAPINLIVAQSMLQNAGAVVVSATNGKKAVDILRKGGIDAVFMDVQMPVMNGLEATRIIREELKLTLPVIALTAGAMKEEQEKCVAAGMDGFVAKPFEKESLLNSLHGKLGELAQAPTEAKTEEE